MNQPAIKVEGLWKEYDVGAVRPHHGTFYDLLSHSLAAPLRRLRRLGGRTEEMDRFCALRAVNFEIQTGEVVGVIGRNGAGKSTLLKILSRITAPTRGRIEVRGRLASLLEVGTGFHPELSGRENIFLNGAILGMSRKEVSRKFDDIVAFAEVEKFIDTPVKRYSSGMYVRLAFAVAAHLESDVLIIDEVLAVGDAAFQNRCLGKIESVHASGRTVIVVSHNISLISKLCDNALWLDSGKLIESGRVQSVTAKYLAVSRTQESVWVPRDQMCDAFQYDRVSIVAAPGCSANAIAASLPFRVELHYSVTTDRLRGRIAIQICDQHGTAIMSSANTDCDSAALRCWTRGQYAEYCEIPGHLLVPGTYHVTVSLPTGQGDLIHKDVCSFTVDPTDSLVAKDGRAGIIAPKLRWGIVE